MTAVKRVLCHCGRIFKDTEAMAQHCRDTPNHAAPPTKQEKTFATAGGNTRAKQPLPNQQTMTEPSNDEMCSCGKKFKDEAALRQHLRDSPQHGNRKAANAGPRKTSKENPSPVCLSRKHPYH